MKKKILIATGIYPPDIGGPATYSVFLERRLPRYGFDVYVCPFTRVRKYPKIIRHIIYFFFLLKEGRSVDVMYALDTVSVGVPAWIASRILRKPLYLRVPGDYAWEQGQQRYGITETLDVYLESPRAYSWKVRCIAWFQRRVAHAAEKVIVPSEYMRRVVEKWGIATQKITRVYSALSPIIIEKEREVLRTILHYDGFVITTAARLVPWKGIGALIEVVAVLRAEGVPVSLQIIGDGSERDALEKLAEENNVSPHVFFLGQVEKKILWEHIYASDVFVLNTSYEGLSHQLIEVMSIGTPIVTTSVGGNTELITHSETGILIPFNDREALAQALRRVYTDTEFCAQCTKNAREKAKLFREEVIIPEVVQLFS